MFVHISFSVEHFRCVSRPIRSVWFFFVARASFLPELIFTQFEKRILYHFSFLLFDLIHLLRVRRWRWQWKMLFSARVSLHFERNLQNHTTSGKRCWNSNGGNHSPSIQRARASALRCQTESNGANSCVGISCQFEIGQLYAAAARALIAHFAHFAH